MRVEAAYAAALAASGQLLRYERAEGAMLYTATDVARQHTAHAEQTSAAHAVNAIVGRVATGVALSDGVVDCCADVSTSVLGHHHPIPSAALLAFVSDGAPAMPFGLLFMKPTAQALCASLEALATFESTAAVGADAAYMDGRRARSPPRWRARLMVSAADANEAAIRLCLIRWQSLGALVHPSTRLPAAATTTSASADPAAAAPEPLPIVLVCCDAHHGHTWLLAGLPTTAVALRSLDRTLLTDGAALAALLASLCAPVGNSRRVRCAVAALFIEPVCSRTGAVLEAAAAAGVRAACDAYGVALVADETRCGLGRSGALLFSLRSGMAPHVATVGEALGGGCASVSAVLFDRCAFGARAFPSSATMVNDNLSSHVALATLAHLRRCAETLRASAAAAEQAVRAALAPHAAVCGVHGRGGLLAIRFAPQAVAHLQEGAAPTRASALGGQPMRAAPPPPRLPPCAQLHLYLLHAHAVRTRPSGASGHATLMLDVALNDAEGAAPPTIARVGAALSCLATLLAEGRRPWPMPH